MAECQDCNSSVFTLEMGDGRCSECGGDGAGPPGSFDICNNCNGSGDCPTCGGSGQV